MHQKEFEAPKTIGIGNQTGNPISSDFNHFGRFRSTGKPHHLTVQIPPESPNPPSTNTHHHHPHPHQLKIQQTHLPNHDFFSNTASPTHALLSTPHKRMTQTLSHSPTLSSLKNHPQFINKSPAFARNASAPKALSWFTGFAPRIEAERLGVKLVRYFTRARLVCFHLRFLLLLFLPSLYFFVSNPSRFFLLNFLFVLAFVVTLLVSLNLALPRLPSLRLFLARSLPNHFTLSSSPPKASKRVIWSIGSKQKSEKRPNSGSWVQMYSNGDVYEGEFHKGQCSGSGVYIYHMKGRYEGDWVDGKYDGYGVETWARGSRYRGQYRQGMRHGIGVYRFYTGDVYAGEWSSGQCHGCGVHTCDDGSRYVGEFKWGVKHGLGQYHFR